MEQDGFDLPWREGIPIKLSEKCLYGAGIISSSAASAGWDVGVQREFV